MSRNFSIQVSVALNIVLAVTIAVLVLHRPERSAAVAPTVAASTKQRVERTAVDAPSRLPEYAHGDSSADRRQWFDKLREAGVPANVLARLIVADSDDRWQRRLSEVQSKYARGEVEAEAFETLMNAWHREQESELQEGLGRDGYKQWDRDNLFQEMNMSKLQLTAAESDSIYDLKKGLQQHIQELEEAEQKGKIDAADLAEQQDKAQAEFDQKLKAVLGENRYALTQGEEDARTGVLHREIAKLNASEAQIQDVLKAQRAWSEQQATLEGKMREDPSQAATYEEQLRVLSQARDEAFQQALGPDAFDAYQKQQDGRYNQMKHYAAAWGIDDRGIDYVYGVIKSYEKNVQEYENQSVALESQGQKADWDTMNKNLLQYAEQTQQMLESYLGPERFNKMRRSGVFQFGQ